MGSPGGVPILDYLNMFGYTEITGMLRPAEKSELSRIDVTASPPLYRGELLRLYIIASEITDEREIEKYMARFRELKEKADGEMSRMNLNSYNRAEFLLHFLHTNVFLEMEKGVYSSYNIGIRETLDSGRFNCYKSALIYNAFLEYYGYRSGYVSVPEHIYSVVYIDDAPIDVETTNRFGFDPNDTGKPGFTRKFDKKNVKLIKHRYSSKKPFDNVSVLTHVYVNRSNIYSGQVSYMGHGGEKDFSRASLLAVIGNYLNPGDEKEIIDSMLYKIFLISQENIVRDPGSAEFEKNRYFRIIMHPLFSSFSQSHMYNMEVGLSRAVEKIRAARLNAVQGGEPEEILNIFRESVTMAGKNIEWNRKIRNGVWNNAIIDFNAILEKRFPLSSMENIIPYARNLMKLLSMEILTEDNFSEKYIRLYKNNIALYIYNLGVGPVNRREHEKADRIYEEGIRFLKDELKFSNEQNLLKIIEIYHHNKKFLK